MEHIWSVLCRSTSLDDLTNQLSIFEVVETIAFGTAEKIPTDQKIAIPMDLTLATLWWRSDLEIEEVAFQRVRLISPSQEWTGVESSEMEIKLVNNIKRFRTRNRFSGIPYTGNGVYRFVVQIRDSDQDEWRDITSVPLEIILDTSPIEDTEVKSDS